MKSNLNIWSNLTASVSLLKKTNTQFESELEGGFSQCTLLEDTTSWEVRFSWVEYTHGRLHRNIEMALSLHYHGDRHNLRLCRHLRYSKYPHTLLLINNIHSILSSCFNNGYLWFNSTNFDLSVYFWRGKPRDDDDDDDRVKELQISLKESLKNCAAERRGRIRAQQVYCIPFINVSANVFTERWREKILELCLIIGEIFFSNFYDKFEWELKLGEDY